MDTRDTTILSVRIPIRQLEILRQQAQKTRRSISAMAMYLMFGDDDDAKRGEGKGKQ